MLAPSADFKRSLDAFDDARRILRRTEHLSRGGSTSTGATSADRALDSALQFVVVGPQSAGKSSVLKRVSGIEFPTHVNRCTRIATLLKLRRDADAVPSPPRVALVGTWDEKDVHEEFACESASATEAIRAAQTRALDICGLHGEDGFVEALEIEICVTSPDVPSVTLVDLPGLLAPRESKDPESVERLVRKYADMSGSLILFVVPLEQDFDTVLGKLIVAPHRRKTTCVLTKLDFLVNMGIEKSRARLANVVLQTDAPRVVVLGCAPTADDERASLGAFQNHLAEVSDDVLLGCDELKRVIEERLAAHAETQLPVMMRVVQEEIERCEGRLKVIARRVPASDAHAAGGAVSQFVEKRIEEVHDFFRVTREELGVKIKNLRPRALKTQGRHPLQLADKDELFPGGRVWVNVRERESLVPATITSVSGSKYLCTIDDDPRDAQEIPIGAIFSSMRNVDSMIADVQALANKHRGLRDLAHVDPQPIIEAYAADWARRYEVQLRETSSKCHAHMSELFNEAFNCDDVPDTTRQLMRELGHVMQAKMEEIRREAGKCIARIVRFNTPPLVFTTNDHYLDQVFRDMVSGDTSGATDEGSAKLIWLRVRAYWKVQVKVVVEAAAKDLTGCYLVDALAAFKSVLELLSQEDYIQRVAPEPKARIRERELLEKVLKDLEEVRERLSGV